MLKITTRTFLILSLLALLLAACAQQAPTPSVISEYDKISLGARSGAGAPAVSQESPAISSSLPDVSQVSQSTDRIVIKNADLSIVVRDPSKSLDAIGKMAEEMGGFIVSANLIQATLSDGAKVPKGTITVRVPAGRLDEAIAKVQAESDQEPLHKTIQSQDVTSDYTDLKSRERNLESTEAQLTKIMDSATKTEDVLAVYRELVNVRQQIEVIKGKIQYFDQSAKLSAINVELIANAAVQPLTIGTWQPAGVAKDAALALINTLKFLTSAAIWMIIYILPVALVLYLAILLPSSLLLKAWRRRRARNRVKEAAG